ncbi:MAG: hypothetical protein IPQ15_10360 [Betaproteobacteria bacterium]|nr:hypothetical protein [Betaproteobacteria bacterium]
MVVTATGAVGTIGGGKLEFEALRIARAALATDAAAAGASTLVRFPLAASVGQCCGGVATLAFATFVTADRDWLAEVDGAARAGTALAILVALPPPPAARATPVAGCASRPPRCTAASATPRPTRP